MSAINQIDKNNSAEAMNKNTQSIYVNDLVYVVCKVFLFVILGIVYVVFFKNPENMKNVLMEAKDNIVEKIKAVKNKAIEVKPVEAKSEAKSEAKAEEKPATNVKPEVKTNANTNKNPTA
jgi:antitoxin component of MazEF toxin-antitoxin module